MDYELVVRLLGLMGNSHGPDSRTTTYIKDALHIESTGVS